ncbi:hypothetical protein CLIB1423_05S04280 [[Candida] railenensis]|uniref:Uncharacterized protein n=1 Tax=[Candida] railenensis TaxID=45579 RepID=A0A9P0VXZ1_9ASCO|nr:hypothetical protein CLIB1423_05S04280 [[Candida] railenensis]
METVLVEIGSRYVRIGLSGEFAPRSKFISIPQTKAIGHSYINKKACIDAFPLDYEIHDKALTIEQRESLTSSLLNIPLHKKVSKIFSMDEDSLASSRDFQIQNSVSELLESLLLISSQCKAILIEPVYTSNREKNQIAEILLSKLRFKSICWIPEPIMEVVGAGVSDSLVVHLGWSSAIVTSVMDLRLISSRDFPSSHMSGLVLHYKIVERLLDLENAALDQLLCSPSGFELVENFIQTSLFVRKDRSQTSSFEEHRFTDSIVIPKSICYEVVESLVTSLIPGIISFIAKTSIDVRSRILENIIIAGGLANIPGLKSYVLTQIRKEWKAANLVVSLGSWPGLSIYYSSLERQELKELSKQAELTREQYKSIASAAKR